MQIWLPRAMTRQCLPFPCTLDLYGESNQRPLVSFIRFSFLVIFFFSSLWSIKSVFPSLFEALFLCQEKAVRGGHHCLLTSSAFWLLLAPPARWFPAQFSLTMFYLFGSLQELPKDSLFSLFLCYSNYSQIREESEKRRWIWGKRNILCAFANVEGKVLRPLATHRDYESRLEAGSPDFHCPCPALKQCRPL